MAWGTVWAWHVMCELAFTKLLALQIAPAFKPCCQIPFVRVLPCFLLRPCFTRIQKSWWYCLNRCDIASKCLSTGVPGPETRQRCEIVSSPVRPDSHRVSPVLRPENHRVSPTLFSPLRPEIHHTLLATTSTKSLGLTHTFCHYARNSLGPTHTFFITSPRKSLGPYNTLLTNTPSKSLGPTHTPFTTTPRKSLGLTLTLLTTTSRKSLGLTHTLFTSTLRPLSHWVLPTPFSPQRPESHWVSPTPCLAVHSENHWVSATSFSQH